MPPIRTKQHGKITTYFNPLGPRPANTAPRTQNSSTAQAPVKVEAPAKAKAPLKTEAPVKAEPATKAKAPVKTDNKRPSLKKPSKGEKEAYFGSSARNWDGEWYQHVGTATRTISFGSAFELTDTHVNDILSLGRTVSEKIWHFTFNYTDVSYGAKNNAEYLSNDAVIRLAKACPSLKTIQLQAVKHISDDGLLALFENCQALTSIEVTGTSGGSITLSGMALDELREHPDWLPKLKHLILGESIDNKEFNKAMRALGKARPNLTITLLKRSEEKNYGDWDLVVRKDKFKKGRKVDPWAPRGNYYGS